MTDRPARPDIKALWDTLWADVDADGSTRRAFLHFPVGTPTDDVVAWFRLLHEELDAAVENVVEISTPGLLRPRRHRYGAREVLVDGDFVSTDGVERPELRGKRIVGIHWTSGKGSVTSRGEHRLEGVINGVVMGRVRIDATREAAPRM